MERLRSWSSWESKRTILNQLMDRVVEEVLVRWMDNQQLVLLIWRKWWRARWWTSKFMKLIQALHLVDSDLAEGKQILWRQQARELWFNLNLNMKWPLYQNRVWAQCQIDPTDLIWLDLVHLEISPVLWHAKDLTITSEGDLEAQELAEDDFTKLILN